MVVLDKDNQRYTEEEESVQTQRSGFKIVHADEETVGASLEFDNRLAGDEKLVDALNNTMGKPKPPGVKTFCP